MYDEDYIAVEVWNDQVGSWMSVSHPEFSSLEDARKWATERSKEYDYSESTYSVVHFKREVLGH